MVHVFWRNMTLVGCTGTRAYDVGLARTSSLCAERTENSDRLISRARGRSQTVLRRCGVGRCETASAFRRLADAAVQPFVWRRVREVSEVS